MPPRVYVRGRSEPSQSFQRHDRLGVYGRAACSQRFQAWRCNAGEGQRMQVCCRETGIILAIPTLVENSGRFLHALRRVRVASWTPSPSKLLRCFRRTAPPAYQKSIGMISQGCCSRKGGLFSIQRTLKRSYFFDRSRKPGILLRDSIRGSGFMCFKAM